MAAPSSTHDTGAYVVVPDPGVSSTSVCSRRNITRAFVSYGETKCPEIQTHYHFQIIFSPDSRAARRQFDDALAKAFQLECDQIVTLDAPDQEFLISIPNKLQNKEAVEFLQCEQSLRLGNIHFTTRCADQEPSFCGTHGYDFYDNYAASQILVEIRNLPLHLWTFKTADFMLHPYRVVSELYSETIAYNDLLAFRCICWTDTPENVPLRMNVKVRRMVRNRASNTSRIQLDMFTVLIRVLNNPFNKKLSPVELLLPIPDARYTAVGTATLHCFLHDNDRFHELLHSMILKQSNGARPINAREIFSAIIQHIPASRYVRVKPIGFDAFLVHYLGDIQFAAFAAFRSTVLAREHIKLGGCIFRAVPWSCSYGGEQISLARFVGVTISETPTGFLQREIANQLLSPFILIEGNDMPTQDLINTYSYGCIGWVDSVIDIPDYITIYTTSRGCQSDYMHTGHHYMPLYTRHAKIMVRPPGMPRN